MKFWTEEKIKEAICDCTLHNFPAGWSSKGLKIWHNDFEDESMALVRVNQEKRGILQDKLAALIDKVSAIVTTNPTEFLHYGKPVVELEVEPGDAILMFAKYIRKFFNGTPDVEQVENATIGKVYEIHAVEGYGDAADFIFTDNTGKEASLGDFFFEDAEGEEE